MKKKLADIGEGIGGAFLMAIALITPFFSALLENNCLKVHHFNNAGKNP